MFDQTWNGNDKEKQRCGGPHFSNCWNCHCSSCDSIVFVELIIGVMYRRCLTWTQSEGLVLCCLCLSFLLSAFSVQCESLCSSLNYFINAKSKLTMLSRKWRQSYNGLYTSAHHHLARFPDPLAFGSGSGLQCVYTVVISLWGTPAAKFVLESSKMLFYWIAPCIRKPQAEFHKISTTHVSPSSHWMPSTQSPLLIGTKDSKDLSI